ncbi:glycosyltransferase family 4 protein [Sphingomonas sp.]|jgi:glycosyltransferase involved in cell wall biosynthesis|uniref:glycosyltransferase family 4 protein n=1 Tax=Sphingomonas sp. TaxID=28214 RepID=UPI002EDA1C68
MTDQVATKQPSLRIASFGFRSFPPRAGSAGADKFALELLTRLAARGHKVVGYNRAYPGEEVPPTHEYRGVEVHTLKTFRKSGAEAFWHSAKVTWDIIRHNRADVVHMQNGGNSLFGAILRLFGKKSFLTEDGKEWERSKWSGLAKLYMTTMTTLTARVHNEVLFDNVFVRKEFEDRYNKKYAFVPYGADVAYDPASETILEELGLKKGEYFLFVGRFIPDKGLHYLVPAFERLKTDKKLVLIGGSPVPTEYEQQIKSTTDPRIMMPGYVYGGGTHALMRNCFAYVQASDLEGLSPVILESAFLGAPIICSDIEMNRYVLEEHGIYFKQSDTGDLLAQMEHAIADPAWLREHGAAQQAHVRDTYSWDRVVDTHVEIFRQS